MFVSRSCPAAVAALTAALLVVPAGATDSCQLLMPSEVELGDTWNTCIIAPPNSVAFLAIAGSEGPLPSPYGTLSIGLPLLAVYPIDVGPSGQTCFDHLAHCEPQYVGFTAYFQFVALPKNDPWDACVSNGASLTVTAGDCMEPGDFASFTQGGWGTSCSGSNPGCLRDEWFDAAFPAGLVLGDQDGPGDGDGFAAALFTSSFAVEQFLPAGGKSGVLPDDVIDPLTTAAGNFAGQLLAATLNVQFDHVGAFDDLKAQDAVKLADLEFAADVNPALFGLSVGEILELAHDVFSGELAQPVDVDGDLVGDASLGDLAAALDKVNNNFVDALLDNGVLVLP